MISELVFEEFLMENLNLIEEGLTLVGRQLKIMGKGKVDLLCKDSSGKPIVIELKLYANKSSLSQILSYKVPIMQKLGLEGNPRLILVCLRHKDELPSLCKEKDVKLVRISDPRIPKPGQFKHLNRKERTVLNHFLLRNSQAADHTFTLASSLEMPEKELMECIKKIQEKTPLNIDVKKRRKLFTQLKLRL